MSFRRRLTLFFVLIVVVPMISLTFVLFRLIADNEDGKADAGLAARQEAVQAIVEQSREDATRGAGRLVRDLRLATALQDRDLFAAQRRAGQLLDDLGLKRIVIGRAGEAPIVDVGSRTAVFPVRRPLQGADGTDLGVLQVAAAGPKAFSQAAKRVTGLDVVVRRRGQTLAATLPAAAQVALPRVRGTVEVGGKELRASSFADEPAFAGQEITITVLREQEQTAADIRTSRLFAGGILLGFFILAFTFAVLVSRSLQRQIGGFLEAARRLGRGDFSAKVPTVGNDEFALLGGEFNRMGSELEGKIAALEAEQQRLTVAMRRIGQTMTSNLDRDGLLEIVLTTVLEATNGNAVRARLRERGNDGLRPVARAGLEQEDLQRAQDIAEALALEAGAPRESAEAGIVALAQPLAVDGRPGRRGPAGVVSVARAGAPFTPTERELFNDLVSRAAVSLENVALHEAVERQAVTDGLTGLSNRRRLEEVLGRELERSRRFEAPVALVMLDIDNFKRVNDEHGHQVGDDVLRAVSQVLQASSREVDEPARYGGEELAVVLPGTDLEGAWVQAERVRQAIEALAVPLPGGGSLGVTASLGAATHPGCAGSVGELFTAADAALYEAKRAGKNRTVRAAERARPGPA